MSITSQNFLAFPPTRLLASVLAALVVAAVVSESLLALIPWLLPEFSRLQPDQANPTALVIGLQLLAWSIAAFLSALLASAVTNTRMAGCVAGGLWLIPTLLSFGLLNFDDRMMVSAGLLIVAAVLGGTQVAKSLDAADRRSTTAR